MSFIVMKDMKMRDKSGEKIWFPKDEKPYFDQGLRRKFNTIKEKKEYMDKHGIISDGSSDMKRPPLEAGVERSGNRKSFVVK